VTRILSSPTTRCLQTVTPLAADRCFQVETVEALAVDGDARLGFSRPAE
jgi:broad specificity phosphatase PhoE